MKTVNTAGLALVVHALCLVSIAHADVRLPHVLGDNVVLQRDAPIRVWGWADPGETVVVSIGQHKAPDTADSDGNWSVSLPAMPAGGPHEMVVAGENTIHLHDVLIGEVWVCSGQSNMEWVMAYTDDADANIAAADYPNIRLFHVPRGTSALPLADVNAQWRRCSPEAVRGFSAVAYYFGRELNENLDVPIGLIATSWGGTRIEPWTPPEGFASVSALQDISEEITKAHETYRANVGPSLDALDNWVKSMRESLAGDGPLIPMPAPYRHPLDSHARPTGLYNAMIHPLIPFSIRGAIWYQGESNLGEGTLYHQKMKALIAGWREVWDLGDIPFYYVQLAPYRYRSDPVNLPEIWEAQTATLAVPNTGMAVTTDITNLNDIHPRNKLDVGERLALWALAKTYHQPDVVFSGPLYRRMTVKDGKARIRFDHAGGGLVSRDGEPLTWFEIAGPDQTFMKAEAVIEGNTVVVWNEEVPEPVAVRFGWHQEAEPNLMNKEGLPASPFRTDRW